MMRGTRGVRVITNYELLITNWGVGVADGGLDWVAGRECAWGGSKVCEGGVMRGNFDAKMRRREELQKKEMRGHGLRSEQKQGVAGCRGCR